MRGLRDRYLHILQQIHQRRQLISQITINNWNRHTVEHVWELAERIAADVPVYAYGCNMESEAVDVLQQLLGMQGGDVR